MAEQYSISLWKNNDQNEEGTRPVLKGTVQDDTRTAVFEIALWRNDSENPKAPTLTGKLRRAEKKAEDDHVEQKPAAKKKTTKKTAPATYSTDADDLPPF